MLLRVRVTLPDRPGALGQIARTLGVAGADIVQVTVLERLGGRAVDDFTVVWPGAARVDRLLAGLAAIPGVQVDGVWRAIGTPVTGGQDAELLAQVAANPIDGLATLVDAVPGLLAADWAAAAVVPADWAIRSGSRSPAGAPTATGVVGGEHPAAGAELRFDDPGPVGDAFLGALVLPIDDAPTGGEPAVAYASWRAPVPLRLPEVTPLRARPMDGPDGVRYASVPFGRAGLVLMVARSDGGDGVPAAAFHVTEVDRIAQLVRAATVILGDRLDLVTADPVPLRQ
ncbi:amino acid-binding protein [Solwaraspora sp. WMMD406]|uniref:amino acid-binding protein n=1 Tax=Solwaraspora sp. WMMD406 TaxID=3016095 RepID=UPI00241704EE|nr:amino acid-binding protein [Solwaraspora sp. WMMD406]MDG4766959.1 amino acid-binding protein [Solwaraspora sp. WMMD406]